ncbi:hypothetical protein ACUXNS_000482 [Brevibacterium pityocampae]
MTASPRAPRSDAPPTAPAAVVVPAPDDLDAALALVRQSSDDTWIIVVSGERDHARATELMTRARAATLHNRVLILRSALTPLGVRALVEAAGALRDVFGPAQLVAAIHLLETRIRCFAVLPSVTRLRNPSPTVLQHVLSWWPGSRFLAESGASVRRAPRPLTDEGFDPIDPSGVMILARAGDGARNDIENDLPSAFPTRTMIVRTQEPDDWWGHVPQAEFCIAPADLSPIIEEARSTAAWCPWCRAATSTPICPLCHSTTETGGRE